MLANQMAMWGSINGALSLVFAIAWGSLAVVGMSVVHRRDATAGVWVGVAGGGLAVLTLAGMGVGLLRAGLDATLEEGVILQMQIQLLLSLLRLGAVGLLIAAVLRLARARAEGGVGGRAGAGGRELS